MTIVIVDIILSRLSALGMRKVTCKTSTASRVLDKAKKKSTDFVVFLHSFNKIDMLVIL